jgi:hypothetical protein
MRKMAIFTLWAVCGRASECAWLTFDSMRWDPHFKCVFMELQQSKPSRVKTAVFVAGSSRHCCWFLAFGDYLATVSHSR